MACTDLRDGDGVLRATICGPDPRGWRKRYWWCPVCECRTENVAQVELIYGMTSICCRCGDSWSDGGLTPRPFARHWRRDAVRRARRTWDAATFGPFPSLHDLDPRTFPPEASEPLAATEPVRAAFVLYEREDDEPARPVVTVRAGGGRL